MEPFRYIGTQVIRGQQWVAAKWNYYIDRDVFDPMIRELMRELPDEYTHSKATNTIYIKQLAIGDFEEIVGKHIPLPPSLNELDEAFAGAGHRGGKVMHETGYDARGMDIPAAPVELDPDRPLTNYLDTPLIPESAKIEDNSSLPGLICGDCARLFKNDHGLAIHRARKH